MATIAFGGDVVEAEDVNYPDSVVANNGDNATGVVPTGTPANGATICGAAFTAPRSGKVFVWAGGTVQPVTGGTGQMFLGPQVRAGATVGSGTVVFDPAGDPGCRFGSNVAQTMSGTAGTLVTGLTPGSVYNVVCTHFALVTTGSPTMSYFARVAGAIPAM